jgi:hypothetical protein
MYFPFLMQEAAASIPIPASLGAPRMDEQLLLGWFRCKKIQCIIYGIFLA